MKIKELTAKNIKNIVMDKALIIVLVLMVIGIIMIKPSFLRIRVLTDILTWSAVRVICALGLMFALLLGKTDLSDGRQAGLAAVMVAFLSQMADCPNEFWSGLPELPIIAPVIMTLALAAVIGAVNGFMTAKLKMASFIATLDMSAIVYGINCPYFAKKPDGSQLIEGIRDALIVLSSFKVFGQISFLVVIAIIAIVGTWFLLNKAVFEKNIHIVGGSPETAKVSGISVGKMTIAVFIIESVLVGLTGILEAVRTGGANSAYGNAYEFDVISPRVARGVPLSEEVGGVSGVIIGVLIFTFISYRLVYIGVNSSRQLIVKGLIICSVVALDMRKSF